jgi:hypothetical protein
MSPTSDPPLTPCACGWPFTVYRSGSGHYETCPAHTAWRIAHGFDAITPDRIPEALYQERLKSDEPLDAPWRMVDALNKIRERRDAASLTGKPKAEDDMGNRGAENKVPDRAEPVIPAAPPRKPDVLWPATSISSVRVPRSWAAGMLKALRRERRKPR